MSGLCRESHTNNTYIILVITSHDEVPKIVRTYITKDLQHVWFSRASTFRGGRPNVMRSKTAKSGIEYRQSVVGNVIHIGLH